MPSLISTRTWLQLLLLFTIVCTITCYRLHDLDSQLEQIKLDTIDGNLDQLLMPAEPSRLGLRSVLWPKICFRVLRDQEPKRDSAQQYGNAISQRPTRRCYPFDMR